MPGQRRSEHVLRASAPATVSNVASADFFAAPVAGVVCGSKPSASRATIVPRAEAADATGGGVLAGGARGNPAQIRIRCPVAVPSSAGVAVAPAGAALDRGSKPASDGIANGAHVSADVGREISTGGGTGNTRGREAGGVSVVVALVRADTSATQLTRSYAPRIGGLSAAGREPAAGDTVPSTVADVVFSDLFTDEEVGLGFLAINLSRPQYLKATVGL
jgi:hypothetical protein